MADLTKEQQAKLDKILHEFLSHICGQARKAEIPLTLDYIAESLLSHFGYPTCVTRKAWNEWFSAFKLETDKELSRLIESGVLSKKDGVYKLLRM